MSALLAGRGFLVVLVGRGSWGAANLNDPVGLADGPVQARWAAPVLEV
jgi:hypothetical protein